MSALEIQIDGTHYKQMAIQPIELAYLIGATPCFTKLAKYGSRIKGERREQDLRKALHCISLEQDLVKATPTLIAAAYPSSSHKDKVEMAYRWISIFVEGCPMQQNSNLFLKALEEMYIGNYSNAKDTIKIILWMEGYDL